MRSLWLISLLFAVAFAQGGRTYPIAEPDVWDEIMARQHQAVQKFKELSKKYDENYIQNHIMGDWRVRLPLAERSKTERIDWVYTLEFDIPRVDDKGNVVGVLYPKGYRFRPVQYWPITPPPLIVFDGKDKRQVQIVKRLLSKYPNSMLIASDGAVFDLMKGFNARVFLLHPKLREIARITQGVSVISFDRSSGQIIKEVYGKDVLEKVRK
jgi:conjugal transfer pilus assembly protein TraW